MLHLPDICGFWIDRLHLGFVKSIFCLSGRAIALQMFAHRLLIWAIALKTLAKRPIEPICNPSPPHPYRKNALALLDNF
ncbi:hypothetical protein [Microcoleus sp.]|uniref:hypothetical protein n=1 Tax=Microcoleus sp. TaxID=44472 RepID=UPI0035930C62